VPAWYASACPAPTSLPSLLTPSAESPGIPTSTRTAPFTVATSTAWPKACEATFAVAFAEVTAQPPIAPVPRKASSRPVKSPLGELARPA
jgi:hypothetical protein